jgi:carbamoyl-phosphate synthase large subunit
MNRHDIIETFFDKYKTVEFLKNNDLPHPKTYLLEDYNDELEFPFLLKPRKNRGGRGIMVINDSDELNLYRKRVKNYIAQEIVGTEDEEYTVTVFSNEKEYFSIAFKRYLGCGSLTRVAHVIYDDSVKFLAERIARASLLRGSLNIQCRKIGTKYIPFEINPRFSSTVYTRHCFGFQDAKWWIDLSEGRKIGYVPKYKEGTVVRNIGEVFFNLTPW